MLYADQHTEKELLLRTATGDQRAFGILFYRYHQELAEYVFRLTRSLPMTEEIVQDAFIKIWTKKEQLSEIHDFRSYIFTISRNHTFNCLRDLARRTVQQRTWLAQAADQTRNDANPVLRDGPDREYYFTLIEEAVEKLSPQQQKVYLLSRRDGLKYEEIAERLQLSHNTVKRHMSLALHTIISYVRAHATQALPLLPFILAFL